MNTIKGRTVKLCTFQTWNVESTIAYESTTENGVETVTKIHCKICKKHLPRIEKDEQVKGQIKNEIKVYANGTTNVKKQSVFRHLEGSAHKIAIGYNSLLGDNSTDVNANHSQRISGTQPRINTQLNLATKLVHRRMFNTAYR